jgi:alpha-tubulin suppressor-like RCC1 family protein
MHVLSRNIWKSRPNSRRAGTHCVVLLAALWTLLALGATAPPAVSATASPGQLYAFGNNRFGELGNPANNHTSEPNPVPALVSPPGESGPITQAAAGANFSLAVTSAGELFAFGENDYGELGNTTNNENLFAANPTPTQVSLPGELGPVTQVAAGALHSLAVTSTGQLYTFGNNWAGELGNPANYRTEQPNPTPTLVTLPGASGPVTQVAAGGFHSLAVTSTGQLYAFGSNSQGQLGTTSGGFASSPTPTLVTLPEAEGPVTAAAAGAYFSLAATSTGQLYAFGENDYGQLGNPNNKEPQEPHPTPTRVTLPGETGPVTQVAAGTNHSLALTSTGQLYAFGENRFGQLGNTTHNAAQNPNPTPTLVQLPGLRGHLTRIAAGKEDSFALTSTGQLYAFGDNFYGELATAPGEERAAPHPTPTQVTLPEGANVETMATGSWANETLVVTADLTIDTSSLPAGETGAPYNAETEGNGGATPDTWSASGLPPGLSINQTDGAISGTPSSPGTYSPMLTLTDSNGIEASTQLALNVKRPNEPSPPPPNEPPPHEQQLPLPSVQNTRQSVSRWHEGNQLAHLSNAKTPTGARFSFTLNEQATVTFSFTQLPQHHHSSTHDCPTTSHEHKQHNNCVTKGKLVLPGHSGTNTTTFAGRISHASKLEPGRYQLTITATNLTGQHSTPVSLRFTILK